MADPFKVAAQNAVKALQQWYGSNSTGLYSWSAPDSVIESEAGISSLDADGIKAIGLWDTLADTLRWWNTANAITALIDYMLATGDRAYVESVVENTFKNGPNTWRPKPGLNAGDIANAAKQAALQAAGNAVNPGNVFGGAANPGTVFIENIAVYNTNFLDEFYDDDGWWALAWLRAFDLTADQKYLLQAETIFNEMAGGVDGYCGGGIYWQKNKAGPDNKPNYKNAIANELFLAVGAGLYARLVGAPASAVSYLNAANTEWSWLKGSGLINKQNMINDSFGESSSGWTCTNDQSQAVWTYNQGVIVGALCELFLAIARQSSANREYALLDTAETIADALVAHPVGQPSAPNTTSSVSGVNASGVLTEFDDSNSAAGVDNKQFKGIFVRNLGYLYKLRPRARYRAFIQKNANSILNPAVGVMNGSNQFGGNWSARFDQADFVRQTAALDLLNAASVLPAQVNYTSLRQFMADSGFSLSAGVRTVLNGAGSVASVMHA